jgi:hypothetical protein
VFTFVHPVFKKTEAFILRAPELSEKEGLSTHSQQFSRLPHSTALPSSERQSFVDCECKYKDLFGLQNNLDKN